jgi:hypothetical protein
MKISKSMCIVLSLLLFTLSQIVRYQNNCLLAKTIERSVAKHPYFSFSRRRNKFPIELITSAFVECPV